MSVQAPLSFSAHIRPLFRQKDIDAMRAARNFDLSKYEDVSARAASILNRLRTGDMPCDGAWPQDRVETFQRWIQEGKQP